MKNVFIIISCCFLTLVRSAQHSTAILEKQLTGKRVMLPNGWQLSPAGRSFPLGDLPLNMAVSSSGKWLAVTNNGFSVQSIQLIDAATEKVSDIAVIPRSWIWPV